MFTIIGIDIVQIMMLRVQHKFHLFHTSIEDLQVWATLFFEARIFVGREVCLGSDGARHEKYLVGADNLSRQRVCSGEQL